MFNSKITIVDFGMGNIHSVRKAFLRIGAFVIIAQNAQDIQHADKLILPGVGHFKKAMENLNQRGLCDPLNFAVIEKKIPILGICLGMQLMANHSEEGNVAGLGWFDSEVVKFHVTNNLKYKVPHAGWNQIKIRMKSRLMKDINELSEFYFIHAYHCICNNPSDILNETEYEYQFASAIEKENIFGVQYHPEKSHETGMKLLQNFVNL